MADDHTTSRWMAGADDVGPYGRPTDTTPQARDPQWGWDEPDEPTLAHTDQALMGGRSPAIELDDDWDDTDAHTSLWTEAQLLVASDTRPRTREAQQPSAAADPRRATPAQRAQPQRAGGPSQAAERSLPPGAAQRVESSVRARAARPPVPDVIVRPSQRQQTISGFGQHAATPHVVPTTPQRGAPTSTSPRAATRGQESAAPTTRPQRRVADHGQPASSRTQPASAGRARAPATQEAPGQHGRRGRDYGYRARARALVEQAHRERERAYADEARALAEQAYAQQVQEAERAQRAQRAQHAPPAPRPQFAQHAQHAQHAAYGDALGAFAYADPPRGRDLTLAQRSSQTLGGFGQQARPEPSPAPRAAPLHGARAQRADPYAHEQALAAHAQQQALAAQAQQRVLAAQAQQRALEAHAEQQAMAAHAQHAMAAHAQQQAHARQQVRARQQAPQQRGPQQALPARGQRATGRTATLQGGHAQRSTQGYDAHASAQRASQLELRMAASAASASSDEDGWAEARPRRGVWLRYLLPALALFGAVFVARTMTLEGGLGALLPAAAPAAPAPAPAPANAPAPAPTSELPPSAAPGAASSPSAAPPAEAARAGDVTGSRAPDSRGVDTGTGREARSRRRGRSAASARDPDADAPASGRSSRRRTRSEDADTEPSSARSAAREARSSSRQRPDDQAADLDEPEPRARGASAGLAASAAPGMLRINSRPWSEVNVDGKRLGTTPQMGISLSPGRHTIVLSNAELELKKTLVVDIQSGQLLTKIVNLIE